MTATYEPGTVALVTCSDGKERRAICGRRAVDDGRVWLFRDGTRRDAETSHARPLVVIDPEDRAVVERLRSLTLRLLREQIGDYEEDGFTEGDLANAMQSALREYANPRPPKPEEPTGLGAVVEDARGGQWVRWCHNAHSHAPWLLLHTDDTYSPWFDIDAVRVLSEGVAQ